jgi:hypothetical protein
MATKKKPSAHKKIKVGEVHNVTINPDGTMSTSTSPVMIETGWTTKAKKLGKSRDWTPAKRSAR